MEWDVDAADAAAPTAHPAAMAATAWHAGRTRRRDRGAIERMHTISSENKSDQVNHELEVAIVRIARALFDYTDSQHSSEKLAQLDPVWKSFERLVANYHNASGRLHPDLCYDPGEWSTLKGEALEAKEQGRFVDLPAPLDVYRDHVKKMIEGLEKDLDVVSN